MKGQKLVEANWSEVRGWDFQRNDGVSHLKAEKYVFHAGVAVPPAKQLDRVTLAYPALSGGRAAHPEIHVLRGI